jgi:uncharacterized protein YuzE
MSESPGQRDEELTLRLTWDGDVDAGYLYLTDIGNGDAVTQHIVENPVEGLGDVILDFDRQGRLLGVEFLDHRLLPPGWEPRS